MAWMLGVERTRALRVRAAELLTSAFVIAPNVWVSPRAIVAFQDTPEREASVGRVRDLKELDRILSAAEDQLRVVVETAPLWAEGHRALARNYWFQGRFKEAMACFFQGEQCLPKVAAAAGWDPDAGVLLPHNCNQVIGLMGHIDAFVKHKILTNDRRPYYLLSAPDEAANRAFLDYWSDYITVIDDDQAVKRLERLEGAYAVNWNWVLPDGEGGLVHVHRGIARIQRRWEQEGRGPLLTLKSEHKALLADQLSAWGLKPGEWYVCLHVRSSGFYDEQVGTAQHFRNTLIGDYYPLIRSILELGGWVVRMGDPTSPPLDLSAFGHLSERVIDYAHRPERSAELDVALCAACRLFVSSPSGLHTVAHAFGRPVCAVNFPIYAGFPWYPGDVFIPQRYFSRERMRVLTAEEILSSDVPQRDHHFLLEKVGLELIHNRPADLVEVVREALDPAAYTISDGELGRRVVERFDQLNRQHNVDISGRLGLHFAATHAHELCPELSAHGGSPRSRA